MLAPSAHPPTHLTASPPPSTNTPPAHTPCRKSVPPPVQHAPRLSTRHLSPCHRPPDHLQIRGKFSAAVDGLWWVFWLAAAAVATSILTEEGWSINQTRASCAFCWITWWVLFLWQMCLWCCASGVFRLLASVVFVVLAICLLDHLLGGWARGRWGGTGGRVGRQGWVAHSVFSLLPPLGATRATPRRRLLPPPFAAGCCGPCRSLSASERCRATSTELASTPVVLLVLSWLAALAVLQY